jgi:hypothetical protein
MMAAPHRLSEIVQVDIVEKEQVMDAEPPDAHDLIGYSPQSVASAADICF